MSCRIYIGVIAFLGILSHVLSIQVSTGYHIVHNAHPPVQQHNNYHGFHYLQGSVPFVNSNALPNASPAPGNPLVPGPNGHSFPRPGQATCAAPPTTCEKTAYRSLDGSCNHLERPGLGVANTRYGRLVTPRYADGVSAPPVSITGNELPSARLVSLVAFGEQDAPDPEYTLHNMQWGQFITHDMSMQAGSTQSKKHPTRCCTDDGRLVGLDIAHKTCFAILVPPNDPAYSQVGTECLNFVRTLTDRDARCQYHGGPVEQLTVVTSYMDLSLVYGNSIQQNSDIREFQGGRMIVENRNGADWMPMSRNVSGDCEPVDPSEVCYRAGDVRVNQNPGLTILHTILLREHNRIANKLAELNPHLDDRTIFQEARKINIAQFQHISFYEWLPIFLGRDNMLKNGLIYDTHGFVNDYNPDVDPSVLNEHATAAFRYFHSQIEGRLDLLSEHRTVLGSLILSDWFNRPGILEVGDNFDSLTRGHATQPEEKADINYDRQIKHFLFRRNNPFGSDLRSLDIQRNRDHGLASYNDLRQFCGLPRAQVWEDFGDVMGERTISNLRSLYDSPDDVDLTVGGSLERHVPGALAGPTFLCILTEQFFRTRTGDRFFYQNNNHLTGFTPDQLAEIKKASMARLLCDNGNNIVSMQPQAFRTVSAANPIVPCLEIPEVDLTKWIDLKPCTDPFNAPAPQCFYGKKK